MNKPEIYFVINSAFPYYSGGRETWLYNVVKRLNSITDCDIHIISQKGGTGSFCFKGIQDKINIVFCNTLKSIPVIKWFIRNYFNIINNLFLSYQMYRKILKRHKKYCIFIALDTIFTALPIRWLKKKDDKIFFICSVRGPHADILSNRYPIFKKWFHLIEKETYDEADEIWANGNDTQEAIKRSGYDSIVIENGVYLKLMDNDNNFPEEFIFKSNDFKILSSATLLDIKGIKELIEAGKHLYDKNIQDFILIFIGKGSSNRYVKYARKLGISQKTFFLGEKGNVIPYLKASNLIACLSGGGGISMSAIEALALKTPVIAWNSPVYKQMIEHRENGYLVKEKDSKALANAILHIKDSYNSFNQMGINARKSVEKYDWNNIAKKIKKLLEGKACGNNN